MSKTAVPKIHSIQSGLGEEGILLNFFSYVFHFNPFPIDKIWDVTKLKAFADDKLNADELTISLFDRVENSEGKGENAGYQHFHLFPQCFPKTTSLGSLKSGFRGKELIFFFQEDCTNISQRFLHIGRHHKQ